MSLYCLLLCFYLYIESIPYNLYIIPPCLRVVANTSRYRVRYASEAPKTIPPKRATSIIPEDVVVADTLRLLE
jgi:hypothetical protein